MSTPITCLVVGAGNRGFTYAKFAEENPSRCKIVGVAEPREIPRRFMSRVHSIPEDCVFDHWKDLVKVTKYADAVIIATLDQEHVEPAVAFADLGYHILLEKPMATSEEECKKVYEAIKRNNVFLCVGHVLRYTPMTRKVKSMIKGGVLGEILNIQHIEPVGYDHFAHSYVRGNWSREKASSFMLMTKSCHDIDWIYHVMGEKMVKINSYGSLKHFHKKNKPEGSGSRCLDCSVESSCVYSAKKIYLDPVVNGKLPNFSIMAHGQVVDIENTVTALKDGKYGRCVYDCDNDVVDNQVVMMEFEKGATGTFSMVSTTKDICIRKTRIFGILGQVEIDGGIIKHSDFLSGKTESFEPMNDQPKDSTMNGHEGADWHLMNGFVTAIEKKDPSFILSGPEDTLESHLMVFDAERMRKKNLQ